MTTLPRADCPICDKTVAVRRNGTYHEHRFHGSTICSNSGKPVDPSDLPAWERSAVDEGREAP
jgi:hypothetical protein